MSTKTTFKRIALVAVASLGLGVVTSVAPASAAVAFTTTTTPTVGTAYQYVTTSGTGATKIGFTSVAAASGDTWSGATVSLTVPSTSTVTLADNDGAGSSGTAAFAQTDMTAGLGAAVDSTTGAITGTTTGAITAGAVVAGTISIVPDVVGLYTVTVTAGNGTTKVASIWYKPKSALIKPSGSTSGSSDVWGTAATASAVGDGARFITVTVYAGTDDKAYLVSSTGVGALYGTVTGTIASSEVIEYANGQNAAAGFGVAQATSVAASSANFVADDRFVFYATSGTTGTQTITVTPTNGTTSSRTLTITWGSAAAVSAQYSTAFTAATADATADATSRVYSATAGVKRAITTVQLNSAASTAITGQSIAVSISGPGSLTLSDTSTGITTPVGRSLSVTGAVGTASKYYVHIFSDGTPGAATITITSGTTTISTETLTFVGNPVTATVTQNLYVAKAATQLGANPDATALLNDGTTVAKTPAFYVEVKDAAGNYVVAGSTWKIVSASTAVITGGACVEYSAYPGNFECSVNGSSGALAGATSAVTLQILNPVTAAYDIVSAPMTFAVGGSIDKVTVSLDSASYAPGQALALSAVAVDSKGFKAFDGQAPYLSLSANKSVGGALPAITKEIKDGKYVTSLTTPSLYAPALAGEFIISGKTAATTAAPLGTAYSVTATVEDANLTAAADAAAEATDAANAATDAANAAAEAADAATAAAQDAADAVAALSTQVSEMVNALKKQITALTNLVIKIQKKVKA